MGIQCADLPGSKVDTLWGRKSLLRGRVYLGSRASRGWAVHWEAGSYSGSTHSPRDVWISLKLPLPRDLAELGISHHRLLPAHWPWADKIHDMMWSKTQDFCWNYLSQEKGGKVKWDVIFPVWPQFGNNVATVFACGCLWKPSLQDGCPQDTALWGRWGICHLSENLLTFLLKGARQLRVELGRSCNDRSVLLPGPGHAWLCLLPCSV